MENKDYKRRDYKHEYETYQGSPDQIHKRSLRNQARRLMEKKYGKAALAGKDVDHIRMLDHHGTNDPANLRLSTVRDNRDWRKGKKGYG